MPRGWRRVNDTSDVQEIWLHWRGDEGPYEEPGETVWIDAFGSHIKLYAVCGPAGDGSACLDADTAEAVGRTLIRMAQILRGW